MTSLKEQKEAFVTGHEGTTPWEILLICSSGIVGYWLYAVVSHNVANTTTTFIRILGTELVLFWCPMILVQSTYLYPYGVLYLCLEVILALGLEFYFHRPPLAQQPSTNLDHPQHGGLTMHRCIVMYLTYVAILAVDFPLFPRRLVKTETAGYSLMDVGASSVCVLAGLSSRRRARPSRTTTVAQQLRRIVPLIVMGSLRLWTHQELEYQQHHSEYGVHWNFFYTLAALRPLTALVPGRPSCVVPAVGMMLYQYGLSRYGGQDWIEQAPRSCGTTAVDQHSYDWLPPRVCDLFLANREGILGCMGYVSIYLVSEWLGSQVLWNHTKQVSSTDAVRRLAGASVIVVLLWGMTTTVLGIPVSRRSTNVSFVLWTFVVNLPLATLILLIYQRHQQVTFLARLINQYGLVCFIVANLLTGMVNLSINTLQTTDEMAMGILLTYLTAVGLFVMLLDQWVTTLWGDPKRKKA